MLLRREAPTPKNVTELISYLFLLSYCGKFLPKPGYSFGTIVPVAETKGHLELDKSSEDGFS